MKRFTSLLLMWCVMAVGTAFAQHEHNYQNGICRVEGCEDPYQKPEMEITDDPETLGAWYLLANAGNVEWISREVANGNIQIDCKLVDDIDFEGIENLHTAIGPNTGRKYNGIFDGQGHRIKNMIINQPELENQGFFGFLRGNERNTIIRNLIIDSSCSIAGKNRCGGIAANGQNSGAGIYFINCVNEADVTALAGGDAGGILGSSTSTHAAWHFENCINAGTITAVGATETERYAGALAGWFGNNSGTTVKNFINVGEVIGFTETYNVVRPNSATFENVIDLSPTEGAVQFVTDMSLEDVANGRLCYAANGDQSDIVWYQTLGEDAHPMPFSTSKRVYASGTLLCDGSPTDDMSFSNTEVVPVKPPHTWNTEDWFCEVCGTINPNYITPVDSVYALGSAKDLFFFADLVAAGYVTANAKLTSDIDFAAEEFPGIGLRSKGYKGHFDGQYHTISNLNVNKTEDWAGFFNFINGGAIIENLILDETCYITGGMGIGLIGGCRETGDVYLRNLGMEGTVYSISKNAGGILGGNTGSISKIIMENCYVTGEVTGTNESGSISGWLGSNGAIVRNCWTTGLLNGGTDGEYIARPQNNTQYTNVFSTNGTQGTIIDYEEVETGALAYKLNTGLEMPVWFQNLDNDQEMDIHPTFLLGHGTVYVKASLRCDGEVEGEAEGYSNTDTSVIPPHTFKDGICQVCWQDDPAYPFLRVFPNADHDENTGYESVNSNDGSKLAINNSVAEHWNMHFFETTQIISGLSKGTYKLRVQGYQRVKEWKTDEGEPYEMGTLDEDFIPLYHSSQYFVESNGKKVSNYFLDIAEGSIEEGVGETESYSDYTDRFVPNSLAAAHKYFAMGKYWNQPLYFTVESETDTLRVGVENNQYLFGNWTVWDRWRLEKVSDDPNDAIALIKAQQEANMQDLGSLPAQKDLETAYEAAQSQISTVSTLPEVIDVANALATLPFQIRKSYEAYLAYEEAVQAVIATRAENPDLNGTYADILEDYLEGNLTPSEDLPNGSFSHIMTEKELDADQLTEEITFLNALLQMAIKNSISEGSNLTDLITNPAFDQDTNFGGWVTQIIKTGEEGSNFNSNSGFTDIYPVAGSWNTAFDVHQDLEEGLPNGIYRIDAPAFFRPGGNGYGDFEGRDYVPAELYINDYYTPVMNIYKGQVLYADAINGVNCRYDALEEGTPHAGEYTSSQDFDTGVGYVPEQRQAVSFAFGGGRYMNQAYAIVTDGKIRLGIRNQEVPWYASQMTMWGKFQLTYCGQSEEALDAMLANFTARLEPVKAVRETGEYYYSQSHIAQIEAAIAAANAATDTESKMEALKKVNDEFNGIYTSYSIYKRFSDLADNYFFRKGDEMAETDPDLAEKYYEIGARIQDHVYYGDLTDEEVLDSLEAYLNDTSLGGGYYVQGDLLDAEGKELAYGTAHTNYPMTVQEDGTLTATFRTQDRSNRANSDARAGIYFTRLNEVYRAEGPNFITPMVTDFTMTTQGGKDFQAVGGEFKVTINPATGEVKFDVLDYKWHDKVFVVGSILDHKGEQHRYKNDEAVSLEHKGNGLYEGTVSFFEDERNPGFARFTIMTCRSTLSELPYSTIGRGSWYEGRYGSAEGPEVELQDGVLRTDLVRGEDKNLRIVWPDSEVLSKDYVVTFDMNNNTIMINPVDGGGDGIDGIEAGENGAVKVGGIYNLNGQRVIKPQSGQIYIIDGKKTLIK